MARQAKEQGRLSNRQVVAREVLLATAFGGGMAIVVPPASFGRIDEALITFLSLVAGAALPGMALTAAAQRPPVEGRRQVIKLGQRLEAQVRFWFGFIVTGSAAVVAVLVGRAAGWELATPRPSFVPSYVPHGGAWLVFAAAAASGFAGLRLRHVLTAVLSLIRLGTAAHAVQEEGRRKTIQKEVAQQLRTAPKDDRRGEAVPLRERH